MNALAALVDRYYRLFERGEAPAFGYSEERISFVVRLDDHGRPLGPPLDIRSAVNGRLLGSFRQTPQPVKRSSAVSPNFLWDNSSYALGIGSGKRTADEHKAFVVMHEHALQHVDDPGLRAFLLFLRGWDAYRAANALSWPSEIIGAKICFAFSRDPQDLLLQDRPEAQAIWSRIIRTQGSSGPCLVTGRTAQISKTHPPIRGIPGGLKSGAAAVSFYQKSFESFGLSQGDNAPVSVEATFAYSTCLYQMLRDRDRHLIQLGDLTILLWSDAESRCIEDAAISAFRRLIGEEKTVLQVAEIEASVDADETQAFVSMLAITPNGGRLAVRHFARSRLGSLIRRLRDHREFLDLQPEPSARVQGLWRYLAEVSHSRQQKAVDPSIALAFFRSATSSEPYPESLLILLMKIIRSDKEVNYWRSALLKALLVRNFDMQVPSRLDANGPEYYTLGILFSILEYIEIKSNKLLWNETIRRSHLALASASPNAIFPLLCRRASFQLERLRLRHPSTTAALENMLQATLSKLPTFPAHLSICEQAWMLIGYYQQRNNYFERPEAIPGGALND